MHRIVKLLVISPFIVFNLAKAQPLQRPKLVVGIVVDQMRWDYLYRFYDRYSPDGFRRMLNQGFSCENTFIPFTPTYTGAGHASVYTGSVPAVNGIIGNYWYRKDLKRIWYCSEDTSVTSVGSNSTAGMMSPRNMLTTTITDELRLATNFQSKTIGISLKDRGSILPAGHSANAAYWFDNATGGWITSTYYMNELPDWVKKFNDKKLPDYYLKQNWNTLYPIHTYKQSTADDKEYESSIGGEDNTFPHITSGITVNRYESFRQTPGGNTFTIDMAKAAIESEKLGQRGVSDFLAISFSSPDYIGHAFGPNSIETEDAYLRLDRDMAAFLKYLDAKIGKDQYLIFLTADHGVAHIPGFMRDNKISSGTVSDVEIRQWINDMAEKKYGVKGLVEFVINYQVYLDYKVIENNKLDLSIIKVELVNALIQHPSIMNAFDLGLLGSASLPSNIKTFVTNGYNQKLSGDIQFIYYPQWFDGWNKGTTHGSWYPYDSHIPLLWFGWKIKPGKTNRETYMTDIAPTVAALLRIQIPNGNTGHVIPEVTR